MRFAHVLNGDSLDVVERSFEVELEADRGSVSLCIIDEARQGGTGTVVLGGPLFFRIELLRLLYEEIIETRGGRHDLRKRRYPGIIELMKRSHKYKAHVDKYLKKEHGILLRECQDALSLVFATVKGAFLKALGNEIALYDYVRTNGNRH